MPKSLMNLPMNPTVVLMISKKGKGRWISIIPSNKLSINLGINYPNTLIGNDNYNYIDNETDFINEICFARTFALLKDVDKLRASGFGIGGNTNNAIVVDDYNIINKSGLRCPQEFIKHKILDCLGDLYLSGYNIIGKVIAHAPGHELNYQLLSEIFKNEDNFEILTSKTELKNEQVHHTSEHSFNVA